MRQIWLLFAIVLGACGPALPSTSVVDKLRILAVQAEPPEVAPGQATVLTMLGVEPVVPGAEVAPPPTPSPLSAFWLACSESSASLSTSVLPCGFGASDAAAALPPSCAADPDAPVCIVGTGLNAAYTASTRALARAPSGRATILLTVVLADDPDGALGCLMGAAQHGGTPRNPDHCVIAFKELTVIDPVKYPASMRNHNPQLTDLQLELAAPDGGAGTISLDGDGGASEASPVDLVDGRGFVPLHIAASPVLQLVAGQSNAAEIERDGSYEVLTLSWYTTSGRFDESRSVFIAAGCSDPTLCPKSSPGPRVESHYKGPTAAELALSADATGTIYYWAVVRDDRGGVGWLPGRATAR